MSSAKRSEILELLAAGKISADEAAELLNETTAEAAKTAVETPAPAKAAEPAAEDEPREKMPFPAGHKEPSWFRVRVRNLDTGKDKVTVNIPLPMFKLGLQIGRRFSPEIEGWDAGEIERTVGELENGLLLDVQDEEKNESVQIYID